MILSCFVVRYELTCKADVLKCFFCGAGSFVGAFVCDNLTSSMEESNSQDVTRPSFVEWKASFHGHYAGSRFHGPDTQVEGPWAVLCHEFHEPNAGFGALG